MDDVNWSGDEESTAPPAITFPPVVRHDDPDGLLADTRGRTDIRGVNHPVPPPGTNAVVWFILGGFSASLLIIVTLFVWSWLT